MVFHSVGFKPRLNKVKASGGCHRFSEEIHRAELDKIWAQIRQGAFVNINHTILMCIIGGYNGLFIEPVNFGQGNGGKGKRDGTQSAG
ncbi:hypothetical protein J6TS1_51520 [Siminovitchia terrae]|uniref:Uncharacterized protein n=1 Tax=Siminovitchia terrae TaxID=1914933 RepID=A0ABQ4L5I1_SIMTE|nr:hypothetical protein [Siminovitchia terrae]GIN99282.1 hypothetical protein J6TS1_51520 [Siminovitchia terrae]